MDCYKILTLKLKDVVLFEPVFLGIITRLINLETLEFTNVHLLQPQVSEINLKVKGVCSHVTEIIFEHSDLELLNTIVTPKLSSLKIELANLKPYYELSAFLSACINLKKLELNAYSCDLMDLFEVMEYKFKLKQLIIETHHFDKEPSKEFENNFLKFLKIHTCSLTSLEVRGSVTNDVLCYMLKKIRFMKTLVVKISFLPEDANFYEVKKPKRSVKRLTLEGPFSNTAPMTAIIQLYPSILELNLRDHNLHGNANFLSDFIVFVAQTCSDLVELSIVRMPTFAEGVEVKFKTLKTLRVGYINDVIEITSVLENNPSIKKLQIEFVFRHQSQMQFFTSILRCGIKHLIIKAEHQEIQMIHRHIMWNTRELATLELQFYTGDDLKVYNFNFVEENPMLLNAISQKLIDETRSYMVDELVEFLNEM